MGCSESKALTVDEPSTKPAEKTPKAQKEEKNVEPEEVNDKTEELNDSSVESEDKLEIEKSEDDQKKVKSSVLRNFLKILEIDKTLESMLKNFRNFY